MVINLAPPARGSRPTTFKSAVSAPATLPTPYRLLKLAEAQLSTQNTNVSAPLVGAFRQGLSAYVEGSNVAIEFRWAEGQYDRLPALVASLLEQHIAVLVTVDP